MSTRPPASLLPQLHNIDGTFVRILDKAYNAHIQESLLDASGGQEVLDFNLPWGNDRIPLIKNEMTVNFGGSVFRVRMPQSAFDQQGALSYAVHCEALWYDLQASTPRPAISVTTPIAAMNAAVSGTGWTVGTVQPAGPATFTVAAGASALAVLRAVPSTFGGELQFDNVNRVVNLWNTRGQATGLMYARGKNATQDLITVDTTNMYTRVYPTGANGIDISTVNGGVKYLEDYAYYDSLSAPHVLRATSIQNTALTTPQQVLAWAQGQINLMRFPAITYQFAVTQLKGETLPNLGDTVRVWDKVLNYQTSARIVGRDIYPLEPTKSALTINTATINLTTDLAQPTPVDAQVTTIAAADTLAPAVPTNVQLVANYSFTGQGSRQITVSVSWTAVTTNADASPITDLDHYEVQYQVDNSGIWIPMGNTTDVAIMSPLLAVQSTLQARVAAVDHAGNRSIWATTPSSGVTADNVAPPQPTPLSLTTGNFPLTIEATWDGNDVNNRPIIADAPDFAFLEVHVSATSGFTPSNATLVDTIVGSVGGTAVAPGLTPGVTYYFTSVAVDRAGNRSPKSVQASGTPGTLPSNYIGSVSVSSLVAGSVAAGTLHADVTIAARIKTADTGPRVELNASGLFAYGASSPTIPTVQIKNDGSAAFAGTITASTITGSTITTDTTQLNYVVINASGIQVTHEATTNLVLNPSANTAFTSGYLFGGAFLSTMSSYGPWAAPPGGLVGPGSLTADPFIILLPATLGGTSTYGPNNFDTTYVGGSMGASDALVGTVSVTYGYGNGSAQVPPNAATQTLLGIGFALAPVTPGQTYSYSVFIAPGGSGAYIDLSKFGLVETGGQFRRVSAYATTTMVQLKAGEWYRVTGTVTLPGDWNTTSPTVLYCDWFRNAAGTAWLTNAQAGGRAFADGAQVEQKTHVTDLITGALAGGAWTGAANGSTSTRAALLATDASTGSTDGAWPSWRGSFESTPRFAGSPRLVLGPQNPAGVAPQPILWVDPGDDSHTGAVLIGNTDANGNGQITLLTGYVRASGTLDSVWATYDAMPYIQLSDANGFIVSAYKTGSMQFNYGAGIQMFGQMPASASNDSYLRLRSSETAQRATILMGRYGSTPSFGYDEALITVVSGSGQYAAGAIAGDLVISDRNGGGRVFVGAVTSSNSYTCFMWGTTSGQPGAGNINNNIRAEWRPSQFGVVTSTGAAWANATAAAWGTASSLSSKANIETLDDGWALEVIGRSPSYKWKYVPEEFAEHVNEWDANGSLKLTRAANDDQWHFGPMWEDLHDHVRSEGEVVDLRDMIGVLWAAVSELDAKFKALARKELTA